MRNKYVNVTITMSRISDLPKRNCLVPKAYVEMV